MTDLLLLFALIVLNGVFAMSEMAIVSSRRSRLVQMADAGNAGARQALALSNEHTRFLSSVQVGITSIGILSGALGEGSIAGRLQPLLERIPAVAPYAEATSLVAMVVLLTYVSLIVGELVPKRLALTRPETIASMVARPMRAVATAVRPLVAVLSLSTDTVLRVFGVRQVKQEGVTIDEVRIMLRQGAEEGVFAPTEPQIVDNVMGLDERRVKAIQTSRADIVFLDVGQDRASIQKTLRDSPHAVLPLCRGGLEDVVGFVRSERVLQGMLDADAVDLQALSEPPLHVPETMSLMALLEQFKRAHLPLALVIDEFGDVEGVVSLTDVLSAVVGELPGEPRTESSAVRRDDGSWLLDGALDIDHVERTLGVERLMSSDERQQYHTLAGLAILTLRRLPRAGDSFERAGYRFEIMDMDANRVDRVLATAVKEDT
jgi:putative hemolysin